MIYSKHKPTHTIVTLFSAFFFFFLHKIFKTAKGFIQNQPMFIKHLNITVQIWSEHLMKIEQCWFNRYQSATSPAKKATHMLEKCPF